MPTTTDLLAADTSMGAVTLLVADLDLMTAYYRDAVTLTLLAQGQGRSVLGRGATPIVILEHAPALQHAGPREAGLFHTAILFPTQTRPRRRRLRRRVASPRVVHRQRRPPGQSGVLLQRSGRQRCRAVLGPGPDRVELDPRPGRDGHPDARPERLPAGIQDPLSRGTPRVRPLSGTFISASETWPPPATSTLIGSDSRPPRSWVLRRCLSVPAAITITWR